MAVRILLVPCCAFYLLGIVTTCMIRTGRKNKRHEVQTEQDSEEFHRGKYREYGDSIVAPSPINLFELCLNRFKINKASSTLKALS